MELYFDCLILLLFLLPTLLYLYLYLPLTSTLQTHPSPYVVSVSVSPSHNFTKELTPSINLIQGLGVEGDAHLGTTVQHLSRLHIRPAPANLRQVHLIAIKTLKVQSLQPGDIGENIATEGIDLLGLPRGSKLRFVSEEGTKGTKGLGKEHLSLENLEGKASTQQEQVQDCPCVIIQGLRNPCPQIEKFRSGLQEQFIVTDEDRKIIGRKAGVMGTVEVGGVVGPGMRIIVELPNECVPLECV